MAVAIQYDKPVLIHIDSADEKQFLKLCQTYPKHRLMFAHAGGNLRPSHIEKILQSCKNVWVEFSAIIRSPFSDAMTHARSHLARMPTRPEAMIRRIFPSIHEQVWKSDAFVNSTRSAAKL